MANPFVSRCDPGCRLIPSARIWNGQKSEARKAALTWLIGMKLLAQAVASRIRDSIRLARSPIESACRSTPTSSAWLDVPGSQRMT